MDRSFLSRAEVIASSRNFVCIRLASYEDETEKAFVSQFVRGDVANTAFAILSPDAKPAMRGRGPGRGPRDFFADLPGWRYGSGRRQVHGGLGCVCRAGGCGGRGGQCCGVWRCAGLGADPIAA